MFRFARLEIFLGFAGGSPDTKAVSLGAESAPWVQGPGSSAHEVKSPLANQPCLAWPRAAGCRSFHPHRTARPAMVNYCSQAPKQWLSSETRGLN